MADTPVLTVDISDEKIKALLEAANIFREAFSNLPNTAPAGNGGGRKPPGRSEPQNPSEGEPKPIPEDKQTNRYRKEVTASLRDITKVTPGISRSLGEIGALATTFGIITTTALAAVRLSSGNVHDLYQMSLNATGLNISPYSLSALRSTYGVQIPESENILQSIVNAQQDYNSPLRAGLVGQGFDLRNRPETLLMQLYQRIQDIYQMTGENGGEQGVQSLLRGLRLGPISTSSLNQIGHADFGMIQQNYRSQEIALTRLGPTPEEYTRATKEEMELTAARDRFSTALKTFLFRNFDVNPYLTKGFDSLADVISGTGENSSRGSFNSLFREIEKRSNDRKMPRALSDTFKNELSRRGVDYEKNKDVINNLKDLGIMEGLDPDLLPSIALQESRFNNNAVSSKGARGILQISPANQRHYGLNENSSYSDNALIGRRIFLDNLKQENNNVLKALALYNGGNKTIDESGNIRANKETAQYIYNIIKSDRRIQQDYPSEFREFMNANSFYERGGRGTVTIRIEDSSGHLLKNNTLPVALTKGG